MSSAFSTTGLMVEPEGGRGFYSTAERVSVEGLKTDQAMKQLGIDFTVEKCPIYDESGDPIQGYFRTTREDDHGHTFGVVKAKYKPIQNSAAFAVCDEVGGMGATWEAGGMTKAGGFVWGLMRMERELTIGGDEVLPYLLFVNSHDGSRANWTAAIPVRFSCTNALSFSLNDSPMRYAIRHMGDVEGKRAEAVQIMSMADSYYDEFAKVAGKLVSKKVSARMLNSWMEKLYPSGSLSDRRAKNREEAVASITQLFNEAPNLEGVRGTAWAFVNAVGEYADWNSSRERDRMSRLITNADVKPKQRALAIATGSLN